MKHFAYSAMLLFTFFGSIWLEIFFKLHVFKELKRLLLSIIPFAFLYLSWDAIFTHSKYWGFDYHQIIGFKPILKLPIEEILFFIFVPIAAILTIEAVFHRKPKWTKGLYSSDL